MNNKAVILLYHGIHDPNRPRLDYSPDGMMVTQKSFLKQMNFLSKNFNVIPLSDLIDIINRNQKIPPFSCVITFDDGLRETYDIAFPILKAFKLPATIFIAPNLIDDKVWFWEERVKFLLTEIYQVNGIEETNKSEDLLRFINEYDLSDFFHLRKERVPDYLMNLIRDLRRKSEQSRMSFISELEMIAKQNSIFKSRPYLSWDEIKEIVNDGIEFGAHTESHCNLTMCSLNKADDEINGSKNILQKKLGGTIDAFAYPYGKYNETIKALIKETGFRCACAIENGLVESKSDLYALKRINIHNEVAFTKSFFACRIMRFLNLY